LLYTEDVKCKLTMVLGLHIAYFRVLFRVSMVRIRRVRVRVKVSVSFRIYVFGLYDLLKCVLT